MSSSLISGAVEQRLRFAPSVLYVRNNEVRRLGSEGLMTVDSIMGKVQVSHGLLWQRCSPGFAILVGLYRYA